MAEAIGGLPSGEVVGRSTHDPFPGLPDAGLPIQARVRVDSEAGRVEVDLRDNPDCLPCGMNLSEATARTSAMIGVFNSIDHRIPKNAGAFRRIDVKLREGCIAGITPHPFSCSVATTNIADRVANSVQTALAELADGVGMAEVGAVIAPSAGVLSGVDPRTRQALRQPGLSGLQRWRGERRRRRLVDHRPRRQRRRLLHRRGRAGRAVPADPR